MKKGFVSALAFAFAIAGAFASNYQSVAVDILSYKKSDGTGSCFTISNVQCTGTGSVCTSNVDSSIPGAERLYTDASCGTQALGTIVQP